MSLHIRSHPILLFKVKLQSNKEQLVLVRKQYENSEENVQELEKRAKELVAQLDASRAQCSQLAQDREILQKSLETVKLDKNALDKTRIELGASLENLSNDYKKVGSLFIFLYQNDPDLRSSSTTLGVSNFCSSRRRLRSSKKSRRTFKTRRSSCSRRSTD